MKEYIPTHRKCVYWSKILEKQIFKCDLKLEEITFLVRRTKGIYGCYYMDIGILVISENKIKTRTMFLDILGHELIHHWQSLRGKKDVHGKSFFRWKKIFQKNGRKLAISY